ncbi:RING/U-box superfamily protein [Quillaja saponaria]|uniref:RING/U-box superfamily protein n=1 Tax=Quillaja saponaria TaxID=32244 RepID=A0AAD7L3N6_QUISA|nr:RING/U-box superfamily protein [Quillaja saponaria]
MAEPDNTEAPSSSSLSTINRDSSGASSSSSNSSEVHEEENEYNGHLFPSTEAEPLEIGIPHQGNDPVFVDAVSVIRDDTWSCVVVLLTFWLFVSLTMILGVYGSVNLLLGPNSSILLQPSPIFVQYIKVENLNESRPGPMLYGIYGTPALDTVTTWTETHNVTLPVDSHKEWIYYLNQGTEVNISYCVSSPSSSIFLIIAEGNEGLAWWLRDPTYPNTTLSWNLIHGSGMIMQEIFRASSYYVALGNLNEEIEVELNIRARAFLYNTSEAYYQCDLSRGSCGLSIFFPDGNAAVLTSPDPETKHGDEWYVKLSYGPRWITYILGIGGMTFLMFAAYNFLNKIHNTLENTRRAQYGEMTSERAPLISHKDDLSSWGSSYDSLSHDENDFEQSLTGLCVEGKSLGDGETSNNTRRLCAICFDAPRDCFFLPCGHCVACFACGTRIAEVDGTCPVCSRNMKKVRRIFAV